MANMLIINSIRFQRNSLKETKNSMIFLNNVENCEIKDSDFLNNSVFQNIISAFKIRHMNTNNLSAIENLSQNFLSLENCDEITISIFGCLKINKNSDSVDKSLLGSCLRAVNFLNLSIFSTKVTFCKGFLNIPGFFLQNTISNSNITILDSIFSNNNFSSSSKVNSLGCSLFITNYPIVLLKNLYFVRNYVLLINEFYGGPVLYYLAIKPSPFGF